MSNILVIGDLILDYHIEGNSNRLSPEAPVPIINVTQEDCKLGGAANVAAHISAAGKKPILAFKRHKINNDNKGVNQLADALLEEQKIKPWPLFHPRPANVTIKRRVWSNGQQICRIDDENVSTFADALAYKYTTEIINLISSHNISTVIFSDYDKGTLTDKMIMQIADFCKDKKINTILDPKRPLFYRLSDLTAVKPNRREIKSTNLTPKQCSRKMKNCYLINTLGVDGVAVYQNGGKIFDCPTVAEEVIEVCGAGDTVCAIIGLCFDKGMDIEQSVIAANKGASYTLKHKGCYVLSKTELNRSIKHGLKNKKEKNNI